MNLDKAMEAAAEFRADMEARPAWTLFSETVAVVLATEIERLRAELAVEREAVKSLGNSFDKLRAELAASKAASVVPDFLICLDCVRAEDAPFEVGDACLCGGIFVEAVSIANWLRDRMKQRGE